MIKFQKLKNLKGEYVSLADVWFTSDTHFSHKNIVKGQSNWHEKDEQGNIISYSQGCRDFDTVEEMDNHLVDQINKYVREDDVLIHCGDWSFGGRENIAKFFDQINCGSIYHIEGNHDHNYTAFVDVMNTRPYRLRYSGQLGYFQSQGVKFFCSHYPTMFFHQYAKPNVYHVFGHVHGSFSGHGKSMDVGIDNAYKMSGEYRPFNAAEVINICSKKEIVFETHHTPYTN